MEDYTGFRGRYELSKRGHWRWIGFSKRSKGIKSSMKIEKISDFPEKLLNFLPECKHIKIKIHQHLIYTKGSLSRS